MSHLYKWILVYGGLGWGLSFACVFGVIRYFQNKSIPFDSMTMYLIFCLFVGAIWGFIMYQRKQTKMR